MCKVVPFVSFSETDKPKFQMFTRSHIYQHAYMSTYLPAVTPTYGSTSLAISLIPVHTDTLEAVSIRYTLAVLGVTVVVLIAGVRCAGEPVA